METLETRLTPAANTISGFVYHDANNNGIFESGEAPIANVALQLKSNATNQIVATATSDATGFYQFLYDNSVQTTPTSITKTLTFPSTDTNFNLTGTVDQFDPSLGTLTSVDILHDGTITSTIKVENTSKSSGAAINGTVSGSLNLIAPGVNDTLTLSQNAGSVNVGAYDGTTDFNGASGANLGTKAANGSKTTTVSGSALSAWQGNGTVTIQEIGAATSSASGGGNISTAITSVGQSTITVRYNYVPTNGLQPGSYTITETQPVGYLDGKDALNNVPIADSVGKDIIVLQLSNTPLINNNFGELLPASISGHVYHDVNNNGLKEGGETPIAGTPISLTGTNDLGQPVTLNTSTDGAGRYEFLNLRPGTYTVNQTQPVNYLDGKDTPGTVSASVQGFIAGTTAINDKISGIVLPAGAASISNDFGELQNSTLSGFVYVDANNNGIKDGGEQPIAGVTITLSGFTADGPVSQTATTDATGFYQFTNLSPGTYGLQEGNPGSQYIDGKDTIGSQGGTVSNDSFSSIALASGTNGANNNFGELLPASIAGLVYADANKSGAVDPGELGIASTTVTLTGTDDLGTVSRTTTTSATGNYSFTNLRPGTYTITETQPTGYDDGQETLGTLGGTVGNDIFSNVVVAMGAAGTAYNFGEIPQDDADVGIVKTANAVQNNVGDTLTYTLTVTNYGAFTAKGLTVADTLPPGATFLGASGLGWTIGHSGGIVTATMPSLNVGASSVITVQIRVPAVSSSITNTTTVTTTTTDKNPNNNTSTVTTTVIIPIPGVQNLVPQQLGGGISKNEYFADPWKTNETIARNAGIVNALYQTILNRVPDLDGYATYAMMLYNGATPTQVSNILWTSTEHRNIQANRIYQTVLGRAPNANERSTAANALMAGASEATIARGLYTSAEYASLHPNSADLAGSIYVSQTGALPTQAQSSAAIQAMANSPLDQIVANIQQSDDALRNSVRTAYRDVLRRNVSDAEISGWVGQMKSGGLTLDGLYLALFNSAEFNVLARKTII